MTCLKFGPLFCFKIDNNTDFRIWGVMIFVTDAQNIKYFSNFHLHLLEIETVWKQQLLLTVKVNAIITQIRFNATSLLNALMQLVIFRL